MIVHLEVIVGKRVRNIDGTVAGRLREVHADWRGEQCVVTHYVLKRRREKIVVPWDRMDWSDPQRPRLK